MSQDPRSLASGIMSEVSNRPDQMQEAIAGYIAVTLSTFRFQVWELQCGLGKSRILHCLGLLLLVGGFYKRVHFVMPSLALISRDKADHSDYWELSKMNEKVSYHDSLDFNPQKNEVILVDECDLFIFASTLRLASLAKKVPIVGVTASPPATDSISIESQIYQEFSFVSRSYWPKSIVNPRLHMQLSPLERMCIKDFAEFIRKKAAESTVLLYVEVQQAAELRRRIEWAEDVAPDMNATSLRNLDEKHSCGQYRVLLVTDSTMMRGVDYRSALMGICLVVDHGFASERDAN